jgi:uncharacterized protein YndB with AHSA1/START domain
MTEHRHPTSRTITLERHYRTTADRVWDLWTTKPGLESWWGPAGFEVEVTKLELRQDGELVYIMRATAPDQVAFMKQAGMPLATTVTVTYTAVEPKHRLSYMSLTDFVPGVEPYAVNTTVELTVDGDGVRMVLTFDAMHDDEWTQRMTLGHEGQLTKLAAVLSV